MGFFDALSKAASIVKSVATHPLMLRAIAKGIDVANSLDEAPPNIITLLDSALGTSLIDSVYVFRVPVNAIVKAGVKLMNPQLDANIMHVFEVFSLDGNKYVRMEKDEIVKGKEISQGELDQYIKTIEHINIKPVRQISLREYINNQASASGKKATWVYDPITANCQVFVYAGLVANGMKVDQSTEDFIVQKSVRDQVGATSKAIMKGITTFANFGRRLTGHACGHLNAGGDLILKKRLNDLLLQHHYVTEQYLDSQDRGRKRENPVADVPRGMFGESRKRDRSPDRDGPLKPINPFQSSREANTTALGPEAVVEESSDLYQRFTPKLRSVFVSPFGTKRTRSPDREDPLQSTGHMFKWPEPKSGFGYTREEVLDIYRQKRLWSPVTEIPTCVNPDGSIIPIEYNDVIKERKCERPSVPTKRLRDLETESSQLTSDTTALEPEEVVEESPKRSSMDHWGRINREFIKRELEELERTTGCKIQRYDCDVGIHTWYPTVTDPSDEMAFLRGKPNDAEPSPSESDVEHEQTARKLIRRTPDSDSDLE